MQIEEGLFNFLSNNAPLTAVVGTRIFPLRLPQGETLPAVTYQRITTSRISSHSGPSALAYPTFQIKSWSNTYAQARNIADLIRSAINGYVGLMGTVDVQNVKIVNDIDYDDQDTETYFGVIDAVIWHRE